MYRRLERKHHYIKHISFIQQSNSHHVYGDSKTTAPSWCF